MVAAQEGIENGVGHAAAIRVKLAGASGVLRNVAIGSYLLLRNLFLSSALYNLYKLLQLEVVLRYDIFYFSVSILFHVVPTSKTESQLVVKIFWLEVCSKLDINNWSPKSFVCYPHSIQIEDSEQRVSCQPS